MTTLKGALIWTMGIGLGLTRKKETSACAVSALLRTRIVRGVPQARVLDPTTVVGLQAPVRNIGSQRVLHRFVKSYADHEHRRGLYRCVQQHHWTVSCTCPGCKGLPRQESTLARSVAGTLQSRQSGQ